MHGPGPGTGQRTGGEKDKDDTTAFWKHRDWEKAFQAGMEVVGRDVDHLIEKTDYINFKALGYEGDPIIHGGRFKKLPMGYKCPSD